MVIPKTMKSVNPKDAFVFKSDIEGCNDPFKLEQESSYTGTDGVTLENSPISKDFKTGELANDPNIVLDISDFSAPVSVFIKASTEGNKFESTDTSKPTGYI